MNYVMILVFVVLLLLLISGCLYFKGRAAREKRRDRKLRIEASIEKWPEVREFVCGLLDEYDCPEKIKYKIEVSLEELFVNIAHYAYPDRNGWVDIHAAVKNHAVTVVMRDGGIPYNPLSRKDPDITLSAEERRIGGLGVFLVKKYMDEVYYAYKNGCNQMTMKKAWQPPEGS